MIILKEDYVAEESFGNLGVCLTLEVTHMVCHHVGSGGNEARVLRSQTAFVHVSLHCIFAVEGKDYRIANST